MVAWNAIEGDSRVQKEAQSLSRSGCNVTLIGVSNSKPHQKGMLGEVNVEIFSIGGPRTEEISNSHKSLASQAKSLMKKLPVLAALGRVRSMKKYSKKVAECVRAEFDVESFDAIHIQDYKALNLGLELFQGTEKLVYDAHEYLPGMGQSGPLQNYFAKLEKTCIALSDAVITVSPIIATKISIEQKPLCEIVVVRNTPMVDELAGPRDIRQDLGLAKVIPLVVYSGSVAPQRGLATLLDAMVELEDVHLAVVAPNQNSLDGYLNSGKYSSLSGRLHVVPFVLPGQVAHFLRTADVAVHPMPSHIDGREVLNHQYALPNKWFEYVRAGLPVVVSDVEALSTLVRNFGNGEVFQSNNPHSLAVALEMVLTETSRYRDKLTQEMQADANWKNDEKQLIDLYSDLFPGWTPENVATSENSKLELSTIT
jgi:glycosyltransferase involved in cell wall biosynthesis